MSKKATDILSEIKEQIQYLTKAVSNQNMDVKLILKKLNDVGVKQSHESIINSSDNFEYVENNKKGNVSVQGSDARAMKAAHAKQENKNSKFEAKKEQAAILDSQKYEPESGTIPLEEASSFQGQRRGFRVDRKAENSNTEFKIMVTQTIYD